MNLSEYTEIRNGMLKRMDNVAKEVAKQINSKGYKSNNFSEGSGYFGHGTNFVLYDYLEDETLSVFFGIL